MTAGELENEAGEQREVEAKLRHHRDTNGIAGFTQVVMTRDTSTALDSLLQAKPSHETATRNRNVHPPRDRHVSAMLTTVLTAMLTAVLTAALTAVLIAALAKTRLARGRRAERSRVRD